MSRFRRLFRWPWRTAAQVRADVDAELRFHLEERARDLEREGLSATGAARRARAEFGDVEAARARLGEEGVRFERRTRRLGWLGELRQDVRFGWRALRRRPGFLLVAVLTLALGVGANTTIFALVDGVLLRQLPYPEPERLVAVWPQHWFSAGEYVGFRDRTHSFARVASYRPGVGVSLSGEGAPERLEGALVSATLFATLGVDAALGRTIAAGEDEPGRDAVVVIGDALWRRRFGADPEIIGRTIRLDGQSRTVVGVMPPGFHFPSGTTQLWLPMHIDPAQPGDLWGYGGNSILARLAPGVTPAQAAADVLGIARRLRLENPLWTPDSAGYLADADVVPLRAQLVGDVRRMLLILLGAAGLVLLIACANVANLLLARGLERERELTIRAALGAGRGRLARQLLTESLLLALLGGTAGMLVAAGSLRALVPLLPADTPRLAEVGLDLRVLGAALVAALVTGGAFGLAPALRLARPDAGGTLGARGAAGGARRHLLSTLVVGEMALAVVLVTGAGLLLKSFWRLSQVDPGFRTEHVLSARVSPPADQFREPARRAALHAAVLDRVRTLPGVTAAAVTSQLPFDQENTSGPVAIPGVTLNPNDLPLFEQRRVSPEYLRALGLRLVRGRGFTEADRAGAQLVALVDERAARQFWPDDDPIGKTVGFPWFDRWMTVVGIVSSVKNNDLRAEGQPALYIPFAQDPQVDAVLVVRTTGDPAAIAGQLRGLVAGVDADVPVSHIRTLDELVSASMARPRLTTLLLGAFAALALLLGAVGLYGVVAYQVSQRTQEIGVRVALGARTGTVLGMVLRQGLALALLGAGVGLAAALVVARLLRGFLYDVSATDPWTFATVPLVLAAVAVLATLVPARRAARVDPVRALRGE
ncbi:MAG TPA: ABC transporter permease [Gemmatimonadaceae bacterium]|nr:ABC transporter permease [Gemmatimonadaceae bacterium]